MDGKRFLLAEDDPNHCELLRLALLDGDPELDITVAQDRNQFVEALQKGPYDCVVLDFNLPDCHADELVEELKLVQPHCPAVVVSSSTDQYVAIRSFRSGSVDFLPKSEAVNGDVLWSRIRHAWEEIQRERTRRQQIERRQQRLVELAETDPLTGLANRRHVARLSRARARKVLDRRGNIAVIMIDLDYFKRINDHYGHPCGDYVLRKVGTILQGLTQGTDTVCRWGGEEFLVVRPGCSLASCIRWAERFRETLAATRFEYGDSVMRLTASIGLCLRDSHQFDLDAVEDADRALYLAKSLGRNRICTAEMAAFEQLVDTIDGHTPEERLTTTLHRLHPRLGPVQEEYLTSHAQLVSEIAVMLAHAMGMDELARERLRIAGLCHDLGKLLVPEDVLAKPGALSEAEVYLVSRHPQDGAEMARWLGADQITSEYIRYHHLHFSELQHVDEPVLLGARILSLADAYTAMTTARPYQRTRTASAALRELSSQCGQQFDPAVVDAAMNSLTRRAINMCKDAVAEGRRASYIPSPADSPATPRSASVSGKCSDTMR